MREPLNKKMELTHNNNRQRKQLKPSIDLSSMVYGKVPPQAKELEEAILGACMLERNAFGVAADILQPEYFYVDAHQRIFKSFYSLTQKSLPTDMLTVVEELKAKEDLDIVGGPYAITKLTNSVVSSANIEAHCRIVAQKFLQRELIRIGGEMIAEAYEDSTDVFDLIDSSESKISNLSISKQNKPYKTLAQISAKTVDKIKEIRINGEEVTGVPTGQRILDLITQGWQPSNLIILAARPAVGKSAVAGNLAVAAATNDFKPVPVGVFSLEMPADQWVMRLISAASEIEQFDIKRGRITDQQMSSIEYVGLNKFSSVPIFFDDSPNLTIYQFKSKARTLVLKEKVGLIIADYLQLMKGNREKNDNREQEVASISRELKQLAKELNIPIIALSQIGRKGDTGEPKLSDLRESGSLEQDADDVIFLIPPSEDDIIKNPNLKDVIYIRIAKHRNGATDEVTAYFVKSIQKLMSETAYWDYCSRENNSGGGIPGTPYNMTPGTNAAINQAKLFIQKGSKMNTGEFDEGFDEAAPF